MADLDQIQLYHITHVENLPAIIDAGGLLATNFIPAGQRGVNIAHSSIQARRAATIVSCSEGGSLHDYVPFYFAPRSPMLFAIHRGNVAGYAQGQAPIVVLRVSLREVLDSNSRWAFTDGHPTVQPSDFYDDPADLDEVDWNVMSLTYWNDTNDDPDRKRRRQAEFLVHQRCDWQLINGIASSNVVTAERVSQILAARQIQHVPPSGVVANWYY
ncbi:DUF4433 domain-containing protein [Paraburkholderia sp. DGU8]|uniref:type II toxin-antitoxin system toxin DNA ADP-ribosyl transferase DarT n=1 Tax=Paraburkholderia sp. DGU8 TaxID=3161997 RepID=UPI0034659229